MVATGEYFSVQILCSCSSSFEGSSFSALISTIYLREPAIYRSLHSSGKLTSLYGHFCDATLDKLFLDYRALFSKIKTDELAI